MKVRRARRRSDTIRGTDPIAATPEQSERAVRVARAQPLWPVLLVLLAAAVYGIGLDYPLFFDDHEAITDNPSLRSLADAWSPPTQTPTAGRPLVNLSFALNYALSGLEPRGYRVLNLALHALNAALAWLLLRALFARVPVPALRERAEGCARAVSLLWLLHPLASEPVAYLTQRTELLAATFYLLTAVLAVRAFSAERGQVWALGCVAACMLGSLCKETIVSAPLCVLLIDRAFFSASFAAALRARAAMYGGLLLTWASIALMLSSSPRGQTAGLGLGIGPIEHLATQGGIIAWYLRLAFWPAPLSVTYDWPLADPLHRYAAQDALVVALALAPLWLAWRRQWWAVLPGLVFFGVLAPSSSVIPVIGELAAERRMYLPLLALLCVLVCAAAAALARSRIADKLAPVLCALLALALGLGTLARVHVYRSELSLWQDTLAHQPGNPIAMWGTGDALARLQRYDEALVHYERMAAHPHPYRGPFSWGARGLLAAASVHAKRGDRERARATTERAFAHAPESPLGTLYRAAVLRKQGRGPDAIQVLERASAQPHLRGAAQLMLSQLYAEAGASERAQALLEKVNARGENTREARALATQLLSM